MPEGKKNEGEESYWCPNSLRMSCSCPHKTFQLPHPLVLEGHGQNCNREGGCSAEKLVNDFIGYVDTLTHKQHVIQTYKLNSQRQHGASYRQYPQ